MTRGQIFEQTTIVIAGLKGFTGDERRWISTATELTDDLGFVKPDIEDLADNLLTIFKIEELDLFACVTVADVAQAIEKSLRIYCNA